LPPCVFCSHSVFMYSAWFLQQTNAIPTQHLLICICNGNMLCSAWRMSPIFIDNVH
jgi:hypothetical protein